MGCSAEGGIRGGVRLQCHVAEISYVLLPLDWCMDRIHLAAPLDNQIYTVASALTTLHPFYL